MKHILNRLIIVLMIVLLNGCGDGTSNSEITAPESTVEENTILSKLYVTPKITEISISWDGISEATSYVLVWGLEADSLDNVITLDLTELSYLHKMLEPDTLYYYQLITKTSSDDISSSVLAVRTGEVLQVIHSDEGI